MVALRSLLLLGFLLGSTAEYVAKMPVATFRPLPSLRQQNAMEEKWVEKRYELIPKLLKKQYVVLSPLFRIGYPCAPGRAGE